MEWWSQPSDPRWWGTLVASFALSAFVTWLSILYARRRNLLDLPGQRRSHTQPTPRGGGIGIVATVLIYIGLETLSATHTVDVEFGLCGMFALALVAAVGWVDDHRPLSARFRIFVHFAAILLPLMTVAAIHFEHAGIGTAGVTRSIFFLSFFSLLVVWSINLHNFMDGINGLLALQAIFTLIALGVLYAGHHASILPFLVVAAAVVGFLPFNFPRAYVFMGDVGSGALGLLIAIAVVATLSVGASNDEPPRLSALAICSAFVTDTGCTLLSRMLSGRRWYSAHREHLYQWMTRTGMSHAQVVAWYMGWNLLVVVPVLYLANRGATPGTGLPWAIAIYALAVVVWVAGKRWCLAKVKSATKQKI